MWIPDGVSTTGNDVGLRTELDDPLNDDDGDTAEVDDDAAGDSGAEVADDVDDVDDVEHAAKSTATALADTISIVRVLIPTSLFARILSPECDQNMFAEPENRGDHCSWHQRILGSHLQRIEPV